MPGMARQRWRRRRQAQKAQRQQGGRSQMGAAGAMLSAGPRVSQRPQQGNIRPGIARRDSLRSILSGGRPDAPKMGTPMQAQQLPLEVQQQPGVLPDAGGQFQTFPGVAGAAGGMISQMPMMGQPRPAPAAGGAAAGAMGAAGMRSRLLQMLNDGGQMGMYPGILQQQRPQPQMGGGMRPPQMRMMR